MFLSRPQRESRGCVGGAVPREEARRSLGASSALRPGERRKGGRGGGTRGGACCGGRSLLLGLAQETGLRGPAYWLRALAACLLLAGEQ
ncbi:hypothetical protein NN561_011369 [Cricetulus griseus]